MATTMNLFFVVCARDRKHVWEKIEELDELDVPYLIVCGERMNHPRVTYRVPRGKYDAINFAEKLLPKNVEIVAFNDVDTKIYSFQAMLRHFEDEKVGIVFVPELVREGPQHMFFRIFDPLRKRIPLAASGELMMIRSNVLRRIVPLKPCKAEDTYMMFEALGLGFKVVFCEDCHVETERTMSVEKEEIYKRKTVTGIYQALSYTRPQFVVSFFYILLPLMSPLLLALGRKGYYWMKGILLGLLDYLRGDRSGYWEPTYLEEEKR